MVNSEDLLGDINNIQAVAAIHKDTSTVEQSASGGAFSALSHVLFAKGYAIYGVSFNDQLQALHTCATTKEELDAFRKSKYVRSDTNGCFDDIRRRLHTGQLVAFSGAPCQNAALRRFWGENTPQPLYIDLVCHGAPDPALFGAYLRELGQRHKDRVVGYQFRDKTPHWGHINSRRARITFASGKVKSTDLRTDPYLRAYYARLGYRPACAACPFATAARVSDISLADAWGIESLHPDMDPLRGVSLILLNTPKGHALRGELAASMHMRPIPLDFAVANNDQLRHATEFHPENKRFYQLIQSRGITGAVFACVPRDTFFRRIRRRLRC